MPKVLFCSPCYSADAQSVVCYSTGSAEGDRKVGSVAADCSQGGGPSGHAGGLCDPMEPLPAAFTAQPQETHQETSAQGFPSTGGYAEVPSFFLFMVLYGWVCMSQGSLVLLCCYLTKLIFSSAVYIIYKTKRHGQCLLLEKWLFFIW